MRSVGVGRALRGVVLAIVIATGTATAAVALPPPTDKPEAAEERTPLADAAKSRAPEVPDRTWEVTPGGAFSDKIPISVPAFHGITPELSLGYESSGGNGWVGVGWRVDGVGEIERAGAGRGAPRYDATDVFVVGGEELVPCATGSASPSCTTGGTHSTENESYARFALTGTGAAGRWTVTAKDGTRRVYAPVYSAGTDLVFRWGLSQVVDTVGNTVTYTWGSSLFGGGWEYVDSIAYNGTTIAFRYETRPDTEQAAIGNGALTTLRGRVKTIDVSVDGNRLRTYRLGYTVSTTGRSLLTGVQQFGKDAVLDDAGTVTGGTSLPALRSAYSTATTAFAAGANDTSMGYKADSRYLPMDINGDGRTDMLELYPSWSSYERHTWLSNGTGFTLASNGVDGIGLSTDTRFLTGDVNGDGKSDLIEIFPNGFSWGRRLYLSDGTGFVRQPATGNSAGRFSADSRFFAMDVDGDGRSDVVELYTCGLFPVHLCRATSLSTGTGFALASSNETGIGSGADHLVHPADVNGDGRQDLVELYPAGLGAGGRHIWLSNGTGFVSGAIDTGMQFSTPAADGTGSRFLMLDVNADGKTDMVELYPYFAMYTRRTWISTGYSFVLAATDGAMPSAATTRQLVADVNGDKRDDLIELSPYGLSTKRRIWLSTGGGFAEGATDTSIAQFSCSKGKCTSEFLAVDVNGDGLDEMTELYNANFGGSKGRRVWGIGGAVPDLLTSRTNGWGGTTKVAYTPSSAWPNTNNPTLVQTASAVTVDDGRGGVATTGYTHAGGAYDRAERQFLGFRQQRETQPCIAGETTCPSTETTFRQDLGAAGAVERVDRRAGDGALLASTVHEYTTNGTTVPRTSLPTGTWQTAHAGAACPGADCKRTYTTRQYNAYGEVTRQVEHGDNEAAGDERTTTTAFVPNTAAYIVDKPADVITYEGVGSGGAKLTETRTSYDGAGTWNQAPSAGLETKRGKWLSTTGSFVETGKEYDARGNLTAEVNELGARTTLGYDPAHRFQTSETNALSQQVTATWDAGCGVPTRVTDLNGQATTVAYDALCRPTEKLEPGGRFERRRWVDLGNAATQHEQVERPAADGTGAPRWSRRYVDGAQRPWRTVEKGPDAATGDIHVDTAYNARGQVASKTAAYYWVAGRPQPTTHPTTTDYDALDRPTRVTLPGGATQTTSYGPWSRTDTDENGHATTERVDAHGKRVASEQVVGGATRTANYTFDPRGNLIRSTDPSGYVISYDVDSLGRTTRMVDPDSGTTTYEWDAAGQLTAQTDAKGQRTTLRYDALGRKTGKTTRTGTPGAVTASWTHDEVRAGFANIGKVTTMTDGAGTKTSDHDALGRVVKGVRTIDGTGYTFRFGFDTADRPLWTTYPDGDTQGTAADPLRYDAAGRLVSIPGYVTSARYDAAGELIRVDNANGTVTTRPHDPRRGWLTGISTTAGGTTIQDTTYTRDAKGKITRVDSPFPNERWTYAYDEAGQLTTATNGAVAARGQTLAYDGIGNITANARVGDYSYDPAHPHAVTTAGANTYAYDGAGLMTSGAGRELTWDGDNLLASVTRSGVTTTHTYDAEGTRIQQSDGTGTHRHLGEGYEVDVTAGTTTKYVSIAGVLAARKDGASTYWVHTDQQGSIQAETDAAGAEVHRKEYAAFGEITASGGSLATEPRGFTGQRQDASGLVYLNARYYDPVLGRFISPNPVVDGEDTIGLNRYAYAANDPVNHTDKSGLDCHDDSGAPCDQDRVELEIDYNDQDSGDYCGPASVRNALSALGYDIDNVYTENALASMMDIVDLAQTPTAEYTTRMLNQATGSSFYETKWIPGSMATDAEKSRLRADVVYDIVERNHPIVANIAGTGNDISDDENSAHTYSGGHYIAVVGATRGGDYVKIADSASAKETYWMRTDSLADWIGTRAYSA
ncbi:RHS repeat-associated core domain-containing protein [Actinokineospora spheciospongiae]|uniref:RHS repeat-associated core domain-containing protein n=1 Tax=Actinokineospora spheciospongiae TaxID=909613 RepID=UPI000D9F9D9A|nr:RHS repeat-associated core domain-containing protein [Actinokineospora spheciospongiae]PWW67108.1 RHS repeat-associated protein [Actinokineospora spheciospongiae]